MNIRQDLKFAIRALVKHPGFAFVAIAALGLGIGVNATVFTLVNAVLLRGLPYENADRLFYLECSNPSENRDRLQVSHPDFLDWRQASESFEGMAAYTEGTVNLSEAGKLPERYMGCWLTANGFDLISQPTVLGRGFTPADDQPGAAPVAILGHSVWKNRYGSDPTVIGRVVQINAVSTEVIGVMAPGVRFPDNNDVWLPLSHSDLALKRKENRSARELGVFGLAKKGVPQTQAQSEMTGIAARLESQNQETNKGIAVNVKTFNEAFNGGPIKVVFLALMGAVGFVLLIACANVANLLLARAVGRSREISIRTAIGASRWSVIRQLLTESVLLAFLGGAVGLLLSFVGVWAFDRAVADVGKPYWIEFKMDPLVFAFLFAICLVTGLLFGLAPALQALKTDINEVLQEGGRGNSRSSGGRRLSGLLVSLELALALILLVGAGLLVRSGLNMYNLDTGVVVENLLTMRVGLPEAKYKDDDAVYRFQEALLDRVRAAAGIESVAITASPPLWGGARDPMEIENQVVEDKSKLPQMVRISISPGYIHTLGASLLRGRDFSSSDGSAGSEKVMINRRFAEKYWPDGSDPIGKRIRWVLEDKPGPWLEVVGICSNVRQNSPGDPIEAAAYVPLRQETPRFFNLVARGQVPSDAMAVTLRQEIQKLDENLPAYDVRTMEEHFARASWPYRVFGTTLSIFALIALLLSGVGTYAVIAYSVSRRTQEIGIRMALGASSQKVVGLVLKQGAWHVALGLILGLAGAFGVSRVLEALLVQVTPTDPATFGLVTLLLTGCAFAACLVPALRASRVSPVEALRAD